MAERFNLTAQLQLQAPRNVAQVVGGIKKQLSGITANVQIKGDARSLAKINKQMQGVNKSASASAKSVSRLNRNLSEAARRFSVITVATGSMLALARAIKNSVGEAIAFERELVKISQVTGKTVRELQGLSQEVTRLSTVWGASSSELLNVSRVLSQAGFSATKTKQALDILAKTSLGATFESLADTTEGAIAVLKQFRKEARAAGGEIKFLEQTMDAINAVSKKFAVESGDLITVIRRTGGVFEAAGGKVNELIALFTSVRATTRESAETIATGLRTIFTRIQRTDTVDQLKALGIELRDSQGQFVGAYEAVRRLSAGLSALDPRDFRFSEIVEELGGFRQVGKVIPLIRQFTTAQDALNVAQSASGSVARDAETAQQSLAVQAAKVGELFAAMARKMVDSSTFRSIAQGALELAKAFIRIVEALEPLLPLVTSLIGLNIGKALAPGLGALVGIGGGRGRGRASGGRVHAFARGGFVPGQGNRDTVPAMLQPGEFVIKKSSAKKLGSGTLEAMNNNRYRVGGMAINTELKKLQKTAAFGGGAGSQIKLGGKDSPLIGTLTALKSQARGHPATDKDVYQAAFLRPQARGKSFAGKNSARELKTALKGSSVYNAVTSTAAYKTDPKIKSDVDSVIKKFAAKNQYQINAGSLVPKAADQLENILIGGITKTVKTGARKINKELRISGAANTAQALKSANIDQTVGNVFESMLNFAGGIWHKGDPDAANAPFDFPQLHSTVAAKFGLQANKKTEAKSMFSSANIQSLIKKVNNENVMESSKALSQILQPLLTKMNTMSRERAAQSLGLAQRATKEEISAAAGKAGLMLDPEQPKGKYKFRRAAQGGRIDSVPALLTPGEYVVNKSSAQSIGYSNLNQMNQTGVARFAAGGVVTSGRHNYGSLPMGGPKFDPMPSMGPTLGKMANKVAKVNANFDKLGMEAKAGAGALRDSARASRKRAAATEALAKAQQVAAKQLKTKGGGGMKGAFRAGMAAIQTPQQAPKARVGPTVPGTLSSGAGTGQAEMRRAGMGSPLGPKASGAQMVQAEKAFQQFAQSAKASTKAMLTFKTSIRKGIPMADALAKGMAAGNSTLKHQQAMHRKEAAATKQMAEARKGFINRLKQARAALNTGGQALGGAIAGGARKAAVGLQGASSAGGSMMSAGFMATMVATTAVEMSSLNSATKQAVTETTTFAATMLMLGGTVLQAMGGLAQMSVASATSAATEKVKQKENLNSAATEKLKQKANAGSAMGGLTKGFIGITVVAVALMSMFKFLGAKAKASADGLKKSTDKMIADLEKGGSGAGIKSNIDRELALRGEESAFSSAAMGAGGAAVAVGGAAATAASMGAFGAAIGSAVPVFGTLVGLVAGLAVGYIMYSNASDEAIEAQRKQREAVHASVDGFIAITKSVAEFNQTMKDIDIEKNLAPEERISRRLEATAKVGGPDAVGGVGAAQKRLGELAAKLGKPIEALTKADFEDMPNELYIFELSTKDVSKTLDGLASATSAARKTLAEAAQLEVTGEFTFDELMQQNGQYAKALKATEDQINKEAAARKKVEQESIASNEAIFRSDTATADQRAAASKSREASLKKIEEIEARRAKQVEDLTEGERRAAEAKKELRDKEIAAAQAAEVLRQELQRLTKAQAGVRALQDEVRKREKKTAGMKALRTGGPLADVPDEIKGLSSGPIDNMKEFSDQVTHMINQLPTQEMRDEFKRQLGIIKFANNALTKGKDRILKDFATFTTKDQVTPDTIIDQAIGRDAFSALPAEIQGQIIASLDDAIADQRIDPQEVDKAFEPLRKMREAAGENLAEVQKLHKMEIEANRAYLTELEEVRNKEIEERSKVVDVEGKAQDIMAKARGGELTQTQKDARRTQKAQIALTGTSVLAGDARGAQAERQKARKELARLEKQSREGDETVDQIKARQKEEIRLRSVIKKTTAELDRLADQSERAGELLQELDRVRAAEKEKREVMTGLISDFVVGGREQRKALIDQMKGIRFAVTTGTLQNQTPEQRSATIAALDRLKNIEIAGTGGMKGEDVKRELIFRDAIRMGLDPEIARQLSTATTKEEELIKAIEKLTEEMKDAARLRQGVQPFAEGGLVYKAGGGSIFKPKGTDTVPAMLTPGEFVIRKSAVDKIGTGNLQALNRGKGGVVYAAEGGPVPQIMDSETFEKRFGGALRHLGSRRAMKIARVSLGDDDNDFKELKKLVRFRSLTVKSIISKNHALEKLTLWLDTLGENINLFAEAGTGSLTLKPSDHPPRNVEGLLPGTDDQTFEEWVIGNKRYAAQLKSVNDNSPLGKLNTTKGWGKFTRDILYHATGADIVGMMTGVLNAMKGPASGNAVEQLVEGADKTWAEERRAANMGVSDARLSSWEEESDKHFNLGHFAPTKILSDEERAFSAHEDDVRRPKRRGGKRVKLTPQQRRQAAIARRQKRAEELAERVKKRRAARRKAEEEAKWKPAPPPPPVRQPSPTDVMNTRTRARLDAAEAADKPETHEEQIERLRKTCENPIESERDRKIACAELKRLQPANFKRQNNITMDEWNKMSEEEKLKLECATAKPGSIWDEACERLKNRGTPTRPAMGATGGKGMGQPAAFALGGGVNGSDTVPAMLTPGEFVMSPEAVKKHGVGFMKNLNRGRIPGFRRGGLIGSGVVYRHDGGGAGNGGTLALDPTRVQEVLSAWNQTFEATLKTVVTPIETVASTLGRIADIFGQGFKHQHDFGELTMSVNIGNVKGIATAVEQEILPEVSREITNAVKNAMTKLKNETTE